MSLLTPENLRLADAVVKELRDTVRLRLDQPGRGVDIRFGVMRPYSEGLWDAGLSNNCGCTGGPIGKPSTTLEDLCSTILRELDEVDKRRAERDDV